MTAATNLQSEADGKRMDGSRTHHGMDAHPADSRGLPALVSSVATGAKAAFVTVVVRFQPLVCRWAVALCGDADEAEVAELIGVKDVSVRASLFKARASIRRTILASHPRYRDQQT